MKAVIYHAHDDIRLEDVPLPTLQAGELLIRVDGCGLCGSDILKIVQQVPPPVRLGHELTGTIVELRQPVKGFTAGQRVVVAHHVPCGSCHYCRHNNYSMCTSFKASNVDPCGFAEYLRVPVANVQQTTLALPESMSAELGSFVEPLACCVRAVRRTPLLDGDSAMVVGLGSVGLLMVQALKGLATRAGREVNVYGIDLLPERLRLARELGADLAIDASTDQQIVRQIIAEQTAGRGVDAAIITAPGARPFLTALASVRKGGILNVFAAHSGSVPLDLELLYKQELTLNSTYSSSPADLPLALDLLASRQVRVDSLISHRLPLARFAEGVALMRERAALKVYFPITNTESTQPHREMIGDSNG
ncbi:MAG TPA: alcohol dehydrogenase catalytic domain-containing protein [Ktedonobacteraceae bacterium]|nr:alcohol dehydrogenase catalytic domain-containing protein [Ktedonobacteraceae bacterium]